MHTLDWSKSCNLLKVLVVICYYIRNCGNPLAREGGGMPSMDPAEKAWTWRTPWKFVWVSKVWSTRNRRFSNQNMLFLKILYHIPGGKQATAELISWIVYFSTSHAAVKGLLLCCCALHPRPVKLVLQPVWPVWRLLQSRSLQSASHQKRLWFPVHPGKSLPWHMRVIRVSAGSPSLLQEGVRML